MTGMAVAHPDLWPADARFKFESARCISTPRELAKAFVHGPTDKCVDPTLVVRINLAISDLSTKDSMVFNQNQNYDKASIFWSYDANIGKYIRIGLTNILGNYNEIQPGSNGTGFANPNFEGVKYMSNYLGMLEQIGYSSSDSNPKRAHMMVIAKRTSAAPHFIPTWKNVATYFTQYVRAFGGPGYKAFKIHDKVVSILSNTSFADLSGCKPACTYEDSLYGFPGVTDWTSPTITGVRTSLTECTVPSWATQWLNASACYDSAQGPICGVRAIPTEPTTLNSGDSWCDPAFKQYRDFFSSQSSCDRLSFGVNATLNKLVAAQMADQYRTAVGWRNKTLAFRAYLLTSCAGNYNALFAGDGFTYTANGGLLAATGQEVNTGYSRAAAFKDLTYVFFCPFNATGFPNPGARCSEAQLGACTFCSGVNGTEYPTTPVPAAGMGRKQ